MIQLGQHVTMQSARSVLEQARPQLLSHAAQGGVAEVDLSATTQFDSALLSVLLTLSRMAASQGGTLKIINPAPELLALSKVYGLEQTLPF